MRLLWLVVLVIVLGSEIHSTAVMSTESVTALRSPSGGSCEISAHGAHVLSWKPVADASSILYMSPTAKFGAKDAIRGGIPICFPQFGPRGSLPQHGFCRKSND